MHRRPHTSLGSLPLSVFSSLALSLTPAHADHVEIRVFDTPQRVEHPSEFFPDEVTAAVGDTVRFLWQAGLHTSTSGDVTTCEPDGRWDVVIGSVNPTFEYVLEEPGLHAYYCAFHCDQAMFGWVIAKAPPAVEPRSWSEIKSLFR